MGTQGGDSHLKAKERAPEEISPPDTLILVLQSPELWENAFLLLKPPAYGTLLWQPSQTHVWGSAALAPELLPTLTNLPLSILDHGLCWPKASVYGAILCPHDSSCWAKHTDQPCSQVAGSRFAALFHLWGQEVTGYAWKRPKAVCLGVRLWEETPLRKACVCMCVRVSVHVRACMCMCMCACALTCVYEACL